jgi:CHAD domain-containing protein
VPRLLTQAGYRVDSTASTRSTRALFDTGDRRLAAGGGELSLNRRDGWRWRRDTLGHPKLLAREWTAPPGTPRAQLLEWTRAYRRGRPIATRATVIVHSRRHRVSGATSDGHVTLVEERLDEQTPSGVRARTRHVDVIDASGDAAAALTTLRAAAVDDETTLDLLRPAMVRAPRIKLPPGDRTSARDLFTRSTTLSVIQWLYYDCELPAGSADALRKVRVALRRLRSDLQTFAPMLDRRWADDLRTELGELGTRLGTVRDGEARAERLAGLVALLPDAERPLALPLLDMAATQFAAARAELLDELSRPPYQRVLEHVVAAVAAPRWLVDDDDWPATRLARRPWRRLRSYVGANGDAPGDEQLHRIRILAKRARYAADMCVPAAGAPAARFAGQLAVLQTVLGEHHDAVVTREWLQRQSEAIAGVSFIAGELAALELLRVRDVDKRWREAWATAARPESWRWLHS